MLLLFPSIAQAETSVQILAIDPPSPAVLGRWQQLSLRIGYQTDGPVLIAAQPFLAGQPVPGINGGLAPREAGQGEAFLWFAFTDPCKVDAIRVTAATRSGKVVATADLPVDLAWTAQQPETARVPADWVGRMQADQQRAARARTDQWMGGSLGGLMQMVAFVMMMGVPLYFVLQAWLLCSLHGGWRKAAAAPLWPMGIVLAYTVYAFLDGSNIFPLVLIFTAPLAFLYLLAVLALHWII